MTTRGWMIADAIVGLLMGGLVGGCRLMKQHDLLLFHYRYHTRVLDSVIPSWRPRWRGRILWTQTPSL